MEYEALNLDEVEGVSPSFVEALYRRYRDDDNGVDESWRSDFEGLEATVSGPSWARPNWPPSGDDALTVALDPTQMAVPAKASAKPAPVATVP